MGSSKKSKAPQDPFASAKRQIAGGVNAFLDRDFQNFDTIGPQGRLDFAQGQFGNSAFSQPGVSDAIATGGFVPLNQAQLGAIGTFNSLQGGDPAFGQALSAFNNNPGISALQGINVNAERNASLAPLRNFSSSNLNAFDPSTLRSFNSGATRDFTSQATRDFTSQALRGFTADNLRNFDPETIRQFNAQQLRNFGADNLQEFDSTTLRELGFDALETEDDNLRFLREVGSGRFLDPATNPFLSESVQAAQRGQIEQFNEQIAPALQAQFASGFGIGGSAQINAQRRATRDLQQSLSDSATQAFADNFQAERARQDAANQFLGGLQLQRGQALGQLELDRAQGIDANALTRAQNIDQFNFNRAQSIDDAMLQRATNIDNLRFQRSNALDDIGLRRAEGIDRNMLTRAQTIDANMLNRAQTIDANMLNRASNIDNLRFQRADRIDANRLSRANNLGQLGLGFTNANINRASNLASASNQRASGIAGVASARGNQRLAAAQGALAGGSLQQENARQAAAIAARQFDAVNNRDLLQLQLAGGVISGVPGIQGTQVPGGSRLGGALGGALAGGAVGSFAGVPGALIGGAIGGLGGFFG